MFLQTTVNIDLLICTNFLGIFCLIFLLTLTHGNIVFDKNWIKVFSLAAIANIFLIVLDLFEYISEAYFSENTTNVFIALCYIFQPVLPCLLGYLSIKTKIVRKTIISLLLLNFLLVSICYSIIFLWPNEDTLNICKTISLISQSIVSIGIFLIWIIGVMFKAKLKSKSDQIFTTCIIIAVLGAFIIEVSTNIRFLLWNTSAMCLALFYLYLHTQLLKIDILSGLPNRYIFEKDLASIEKKINIPIVVFDINNLKIINDSFGHRAGDKLITSVAKAIEKSFYKGKCYRIGGDEFVFIGTQMLQRDLDEMIESFIHEIDNPKSVAYGYYFTSSVIDAVHVFNNADDNMYSYKNKIKKEMEK